MYYYNNSYYALPTKKLFDNFIWSNFMKHVEHSITAVNRRIISGYTSQIMQKYVLIKKGFGQGMGATNAQNRMKRI